MIDEEGSFYYGFNVAKGKLNDFICTEQVCDMVEDGVVDSFSVIKTIL